MPMLDAYHVIARLGDAHHHGIDAPPPAAGGADAAGEGEGGEGGEGGGGGGALVVGLELSMLTCDGPRVVAALRIDRAPPQCREGNAGKSADKPPDPAEEGSVGVWTKSWTIAASSKPLATYWTSGWVGGGGAAREDGFSACGEWAALGECRRNAPFMQQSCTASCRVERAAAVERAWCGELGRRDARVPAAAAAKGATAPPAPPAPPFEWLPEPAACAPHCARPCAALNGGDLQAECGGCRSERACWAGADDFGPPPGGGGDGAARAAAS